MEKVKRLLSILLIITMIIGLLPMMAFATVGDEFTVDDLNYKILTEGTRVEMGTVDLMGETVVTDLTVPEAVYGDETIYTAPEGQVEAYSFKLTGNQNIIQPMGTYDYEIDLGNINKNANGVDDGYTVGNYGVGPLIYLNQANKSYRVHGKTDCYGLAIDGENISLTLDGVNIDMDDWNNALNLSTDLTLNLEGKNELSGTGSAIGIYTGEWDLTIQGTGSLETNSALLISEIKDFTLKSGRIHGRLVADNIRIEGGTVNAAAEEWNSHAIEAESSVTITGGTLDIQSKSGHGIHVEESSGTITITGGSVNVTGGEGFGPTNIAPTDGYSTVYKTKLGGLPANTLITVLTAPDGYGYTDMYTDDGGWLYLWLPEDEQTVAFNAGTTVVDNTFTIAANNDNIFAAVDKNIDVDSGADLKVALESQLPSNINVTGDFECSLQIKLRGNHTLTIPTGKTVAIAYNGFIDLQSNTLNIKGGGELILQGGYPYNFYGDQGMLDLEDITVTSRAAGMGAIRVKNVIVGDGATIVSDGESAHYLLRIEEGHTCIVKLGGTIDTGSFWDYGILIAGGVLHIDGGTVKLGRGEGINNALFIGSGSLKNTSGSLDAGVDAVIYLTEGAMIQGFANSFKDRGFEFIAEEEITVGERDELPSAYGLTEGSYYRDVSFFSKEAIAITAQPQSLEFHQGEITGSLTVSAEASNDSPIGYQWCTTDEYGSYDGIDGATGDTFPIPSDLTPGTYYYVCWLNADKCDSVSSNIAGVTIIGEFPAVPYTLTIDGSYAPTSGGGIYMEGETVSINAGNRSGYSFAGWTSSDNISFADKNSTTTTFIMPGKFIRVTANWIRNGGSSGDKDKDKGSPGGSGGSGTSPTTPTTPLTPATPTAPNEAKPADTDKPKTEERTKVDVKKFTDFGGHWATDDITYVLNRGLFSGTSQSTFSPNTNMTRGMFVTVLGRLAGADTSGYGESGFADVNADAYYMGFVEWASNNNIVNGVGDNNFAPDRAISREQMAVIIFNYLKAMNINLPKVNDASSFADNDKISDYAREAILAMQKAGILTGKGDNFFDPQGTATRAEVAAVIRRLAEALAIE